MSSDEAIQLTNNDACNFKAYAVNKGYWNDPYISYFSTTPKQQLSEHKPPEMSLGYFSRVNAMRSIISKFLDKYSTNCQIINLGAGYDTLFFNLLDKNQLPFRYVEVDFPRIVMSKIRFMKSKKTLLDKLRLQVNETSDQTQTAAAGETDSAGFKIPSLLPAASASLPLDLHSSTELHLRNYHLISADLRNISEFDNKLSVCDIDSNMPTLVLAECVLVYMTTEHSNQLLKHLTSRFRTCSFVNYEQVNLNDKFGEIMLGNMQLRECKLLGTDACGSIDSQYNRFVQSGFDMNVCQVITMTDYYQNKMPQHERIRIESLEFLDEKELLIQLMDHYCICIAANSYDLKFLLF